MTTYRSVNEALPSLAVDLLDLGADVPSRAGATKELTFQHVTLNKPLEREIIVPTRKANLAAQIAETVWVLAGRNDVDWLVHYLPRAGEFSDDGLVWRAGYGPRLRTWHPYTGPIVDQLGAVVKLLQDDPTTRRAVMSIWDPAQDLKPSKDIPCNNWLHFLARDGVVDLHVAIRSNDLVWGWSGINQFEWSVLLEVVAAYAGLTVGRVHYSVSSLHMYDRHWDKARTYKPRSFYETEPTPRFDPFRTHDGHHVPGGVELDQLLTHFFTLEEALRSGNHKPELFEAIGAYPEPMLRSWLMVLAWWWTGDWTCLVELAGTRLEEAARCAVQPPQRDAGATTSDPGPASGTQGPPSGAELAARPLARYMAGREAAKAAHPAGGSFMDEVIRLHTEKDAAYGHSWKQRGELFSILPNIARKVDRLGNGETSDENATDTAVDLMVYLAKYRTWLGDQTADPEFANYSDTPHAANDLLRDVEQEMSIQMHPWTTSELEDEQRQGLEELMDGAGHQQPAPERVSLVDHLLRRAYVLAVRRWYQTPALFAREAEHYLGADHE